MIFSIGLVIAIFNLSVTNAVDVLEVTEKRKEVVKKVQGEAFIVEIGLKNIGKNEGNWNINIVFEGDTWSQEGNSQDLKLEPGEERIVSWTGNIPEDAPINTLARLVIYYGDSFKALNWWIKVVPGAELSITSSCVK